MLCVLPQNMVSRSCRQLERGSSFSARVSGEDGPRMAWGFSFLRTAELLFGLKPHRLTNDKDSASRNDADASLSRTLSFRCVVS